jgi:3-oxoacyl-[acyl-carrier-protein] synthase II
MTKAVITGIGPVSAIGHGAESFWKALLAGQSGIGPITACDVSGSPSKVGAEILDFRLERYIKGGRAIARSAPRPVVLALGAAALAIDDAEIDLAATNRQRVGVYVGTSVGQLDYCFELRDRWQSNRPLTASGAFQAFNHSVACIASSHFDLQGPVHTTSTGCNSGMDALALAAQAIQLGLVDAAVVIGTDCEVTAEIFALLNASSSLATRFNDRPKAASRPFDIDRDGNVLGEGAAALMLESPTHARKRGARAYATVAGAAVQSSGHRRYHATKPSLDMRPCVRAFIRAMESAGWSAADVQVFNANGSSSRNYDRLEGMALAATFGTRLAKLPIHSTKGALGQHGAGSSALQITAACLTIASGQIPPTLNCDRLDPACGPLRIIRQPVASETDRVLVHSIGLGGFYYSAMALEAPTGSLRRRR